MAQLEQIQPGTLVAGIVPEGPVLVVAVQWHGSGALTVTYKPPSGRPDERLLLRADEPLLGVSGQAQRWALDADGALFRLASEAQRIRLAHLFDPYLAVTTSLVQPLPHQITAVYGEMLPRLPLRFLLADDPGAGKTIMTGLLIKELLLRGDLRRCLIVCPGGLILQWQAEMEAKFGLDFRLLGADVLAQGGNPFLRHDLLLARMDHLARNFDLQEQLRGTEWDLVVVDEAHKMSARLQGSEVRPTKRYALGRLLGDPERTRHFLLLTATPHNGKDEDFYLFLALLDADRFEGRVAQPSRRPDISDLMRRLSKEHLVRFDGSPLFPPRFAHTAEYGLSDPERELYEAVTLYVRDQMDRADRLKAQGEAKRGQAIGLALTVLQRRLASSPEAIYQTLGRRKERLERELEEAERSRQLRLAVPDGRLLDDETHDEDDDTAEEREAAEDEVAAAATAATTIEELRLEIGELTRLIEQAAAVRQSRVDSKWRELSGLLQDNPLMFTPDNRRHKLIIFTEHRDTLTYLTNNIRDLLGRPEAVVTIQGGMDRQERRNVEERFLQDPDVWILVATDAAGEGVNLQRAHLVINYDLPWNPNRLEQRFGRVHRIGQDEDCHMWSLLAAGTREADVFETLLRKLEAERHALPGDVFDVLGRAFAERSLRDLLIEAIRRGRDPDVRSRLRTEMEHILDLDRIRELQAEQALVGGALDAATVQEIRERMQRAHAARLQPHFIGGFFREAFPQLGGRLKEREPGRYEIGHVPLEVRDRARALGSRAPILARYERITFEPGLRQVTGLPEAAFVCPGHPLFDAVLDLTLERHQGLLQRGSVLLDPEDWGEDPYWLWYVEHEIVCGGRPGPRTLSRRLLFVRQAKDGRFERTGPAPYLSCRPLKEAEREVLSSTFHEHSERGAPEDAVVDYAIREVVPAHIGEVRTEHERRMSKVLEAVHDRLTREISYWDRRAQDLREQERAGRQPRMNPINAERRATELAERLRRREDELRAEAQVSPKPPVLRGGVLVVPWGLVARISGAQTDQDASARARETRRVEAISMDAVMEHERRLGHEPRSVAASKCGYDVESRTPKGDLRFIEVKGRVADADTVTVTRHEILTALNEPENFRLAIVRVDGERPTQVAYIRQPFDRDPGFGVESVTFNIAGLLQRAESSDSVGA